MNIYNIANEHIRTYIFFPLFRWWTIIIFHVYMYVCVCVYVYVCVCMCVYVCVGDRCGYKYANAVWTY